MSDYTGWVHDDGCVVCPDCNEFISCSPDIPSILAAADAHQREQES